MCLVSVLDQGMRQTVPLVLWIPPEASLYRLCGTTGSGENDGAGRRKPPVWFPAPLSFGLPEGAGTRRRCGPLGAGVKRRSRRRAVILVTLVITAIGCDD